MNVFKNKVGRPSNETIKKRKMIKITIFAFCFLLLLSAIIIFSNKFNKSEISGTEKNVDSVSISFTNYNTSKPVYGQTVTFKHSIINAKNKYQKWYIFQDGIKTKEGDCTKINTNNYVESDSLAPSPSKTKKLTVMVYSDKKCTRKIKEASSNSFTWPSDDNKKMTLTFSDYNYTNTNLGLKETPSFTYTINNAKGYYEMSSIYKNGVVEKKSECRKIDYGNYYRINTISPTSDSTKYMNVTIYKDSKCTSKVLSSNSKIFTWPKEEKTTTDPQIEKKINTDKKTAVINDLINTNYSEETSVNILLDMYNFKDKYYKIDIYSEGKFYKNYSKGQIKYSYFYVNVLLNIFNKEYINLSICEDSNCSKIINEYKSKTYTVKKVASTSNVITLSEPTVKNYFKEQTLSFKFNIKNSKSMYYRYNTYTNGARQYTGKCIKISSNSFNGTFTMLMNKNVISGRYAEVLLYNNSSCKTIISSKRTTNYNFINIKYNSKYINTGSIVTISNNQKLNLAYTITGASGKYYNYSIYNYNTGKIITTSKCTYINTNSKTSSLIVGPYSKNTKIYVKTNIYDSSTCSKSLVSTRTSDIQWK